MNKNRQNLTIWIQKTIDSYWWEDEAKAGSFRRCGTHIQSVFKWTAHLIRINKKILDLYWLSIQLITQMQRFLRYGAKSAKNERTAHPIEWFKMFVWKNEVFILFSFLHYHRKSFPQAAKLHVKLNIYLKSSIKKRLYSHHLEFGIWTIIWWYQKCSL